MPKLGTRLDVSSALTSGQAADVAGEWRRNEDYGSIDVQFFESLARRCAQVRRHGDDEWRRVARRSSPRRPGYLQTNWYCQSSTAREPLCALCQLESRKSMDGLAAV